MNAPFLVWGFDRRTGDPGVIAQADTLTAARGLLHGVHHGVITRAGRVVDSLGTQARAALVESAAAEAWAGQASPTPAAQAPVRKAPAPRPSPRPFVGGVLTETPVAEPIGVQLARKPAQAAAARDAPLVEQLRGEVEGLTTDLSVARHDLARAVGHNADLRAQLDDARALLDLAMTAGLAAAAEARAEADRVARHAGELSRRLAAAQDAAAAPAPPALDDLALARIARASERGTLRALGLSALVTRHGGVEQVEQLLEGVGRLMKAVG